MLVSEWSLAKGKIYREWQQAKKSWNEIIKLKIEFSNQGKTTLGLTKTVNILHPVK